MKASVSPVSSNGVGVGITWTTTARAVLAQATRRAFGSSTAQSGLALIQAEQSHAHSAMATHWMGSGGWPLSGPLAKMPAPAHVPGMISWLPGLAGGDGRWSSPSIMRSVALAWAGEVWRVDCGLMTMRMAVSMGCAIGERLK
jgi:hypothetical protein